MKIAVWKYLIPMRTTFTLDMPHGARMLSVQMQQGQPCLWALVNTEAPKTPHVFYMLNTGDIATGVLLGRYIGTWQSTDGNFVHHLFDQEAQP